MCITYEVDAPEVKIPDPPPLPPPPPPPAPPVKPPPEPTSLEAREINPQVRRTKTSKELNPQTKGTGALRIKLDQPINTGQTQEGGKKGGVNV